MARELIDFDKEEARRDHIETLELIAKLNNWKTSVHRIDDNVLIRDLYQVINNRIKQLNEKVEKLEKILKL